MLLLVTHFLIASKMVKSYRPEYYRHLTTCNNALVNNCEEVMKAMWVNGSHVAKLSHVC